MTEEKYQQMVCGITEFVKWYADAYELKDLGVGDDPNVDGTEQIYGFTVYDLEHSPQFVISWLQEYTDDEDRRCAMIAKRLIDDVKEYMGGEQR